MIDELSTIQYRIAQMSARTRRLLALSEVVGLEARRTTKHVQLFLSTRPHFGNSVNSVKQSEDRTNDHGTGSPNYRVLSA